MVEKKTITIDSTYVTFKTQIWDIDNKKWKTIFVAQIPIDDIKKTINMLWDGDTEYENIDNWKDALKYGAIESKKDVKCPICGADKITVYYDENHGFFCDKCINKRMYA